MSKAAWVFISIVIAGECLVIFSAPIVGQFQHGLLPKRIRTAFDGILRNFLVIRGDVAKKKQREFHVRKIELPDQGHSQNALVEVQRSLGIPDTKHCLIEDEPFSLGQRNYLSLAGIQIYAGRLTQLLPPVSCHRSIYRKTLPAA